MGSHQSHESSDDRATAPAVRPRPWQELIPQARVKPQYDPAEVARRFLEDMEKGGRLHGQNQRADGDG